MKEKEYKMASTSTFPKTGIYCMTRFTFRKLKDTLEDESVVYKIRDYRDIPSDMDEWNEMASKTKAVVKRDGRWVSYGE